MIIDSPTTDSMGDKEIKFSNFHEKLTADKIERVIREVHDTILQIDQVYEVGTNNICLYLCFEIIQLIPMSNHNEN